MSFWNSKKPRWLVFALLPITLPLVVIVVLFGVFWEWWHFKVSNSIVSGLRDFDCWLDRFWNGPPEPEESDETD
jgi:hypothetical protein